MTLLGGGKPMRPQQLTAGQRANITSRLRRDKALNRLLEIATEGKYGRAEEAETESASATVSATAPASGATVEAPPPTAEAWAVAAPANGAPEQTLIRGAQEAARLGAALGKETPAAGAAAAAEQSIERGGESPQKPKSSEPQALSGAGTEVPKSGA
jgi:hypothetical protein